MRRKKKHLEILDQVTMEDVAPQKRRLIFVPSEVAGDDAEEMCFDDPTKIMKNPTLPDEVKKNRAHLFHEVVNMSVNDIFSAEKSAEFEEKGGVTLLIKDKVFISYRGDLAKQLTSFDKEVIDAVATLAPHLKVVSATTIFRIISGKQDGTVNAVQRKKVDESMRRCKNYSIEIDLTDEYLESAPDEVGNVTSLKYSGDLINFTRIDKKAKNGSNIYYKILEIPPLFRYAEAIGEISAFPLTLLNTPLKKTENMITVQSYLLREIDGKKYSSLDNNFILWDDVYRVAELDFHSGQIRQKKSRVRKYCSTMLDYWKSEKFIHDFKTTKKDKASYLEIVYNSQ